MKKWKNPELTELGLSKTKEEGTTEAIFPGHQVKCPYCQETFYKEENLKKHIDRAHNYPVTLPDDFPVPAS